MHDIHMRPRRVFLDDAARWGPASNIEGGVGTLSQVLPKR
jgi:hypothetical protein